MLCMLLLVKNYLHTKLYLEKCFGKKRNRIPLFLSSPSSPDRPRALSGNRIPLRPGFRALGDLLQVNKALCSPSRPSLLFHATWSCPSSSLATVRISPTNEFAAVVGFATCCVQSTVTFLPSFVLRLRSPWVLPLVNSCSVSLVAGRRSVQGNSCPRFASRASPETSPSFDNPQVSSWGSSLAPGTFPVENRAS